MAKVVKKESYWRIAGAVGAGYFVISLLIVFTDWLMGFTIPALRTAREMPTYYFVVVTVSDSLYGVAGGYLCAKIARTAAQNATLGLIGLGELVAIASTFNVWYTVPHWYSIALLLLYPPLVWAGSLLRLRVAPVKPMLVKVRT